MIALPKIAVLAASLLLAAPLPSRGAEVATPNDTARFLAGMQPSANSPLARLTDDPAWQHHARFLDAAFARLERSQLSKIRAWANVNLAAPRPTMFYMFSGPDFLYANAFYPKASTYVLSALEPPGSVPDLARLPRGGADAALYNVEHSLSSILTFSFFITKQMKADLRAGEVSGTLPILYVFLARSGKTIHSVTPVALDGRGALTLAGAPHGRITARGMRIMFSGADGVQRALYYFSTDLSNSSVRGSGFLKFCGTLAPGNSLLKSASYLLHERSFSTVRNWLLNNSAAIIQDDSGIPLADYNRRAWRLFPFGRYLGPIDKFPDRYQPQYAELFARARPLDFGIGYRWRAHESNLLLAIKVARDVPAFAASASTDEAVPQRSEWRRRMRPPPAFEPPQPRGFFWFGR